MQIPASNFTTTLDEQLQAFAVYAQIPRTTRTTDRRRYREFIALVDLKTVGADTVRRLQFRYSPN